MSQPRPVPNRVTIASKVVSSATRTDSNSSCRLSGKCSQSAREVSTPVFASSVRSSFATSGTHEPHCVPARVQVFSGPISEHPSAVIALRIVPAVTVLHEQTSAESGSSPVSGASPPGAER